MIRLFTFLLIGSVLLWMRARAVGNSSSDDRNLSGPLDSDDRVNVIRMKRVVEEAAPRGGRPSRDMSGKVSDHHVHGPEYGLDLPPLCPRVQNHTDVHFKYMSGAMDPYGLPCLLEMHWSSQDAPSFDTVHCHRKYRLHGFTDWVCSGHPQLVTRFNMVYHIECLDIGPGGEITTPYIDPNVIANPAWVPHDDKGGPHLSPGHYCYMRYAIEPNNAWFTAKIVTTAAALAGSVLMIIGFLMANTCAAFVTNVFYAFAVASITGVSFVVIQFSDHMSNDSLWWISIGNFAVVVVLSYCWMIPTVSNYLSYRNGYSKRNDLGASFEACEERWGKDVERGGDEEDLLHAYEEIDYNKLATALSGMQETGIRPRGSMKVAMMDTTEMDGMLPDSGEPPDHEEGSRKTQEEEEEKEKEEKDETKES